MMFKDFPNIGFLVDELDATLFNNLKQEAEYIKNNQSSAEKQNTYLGDNFSNVFKLTKTKKDIEGYVFALIAEYRQKYPMYEDNFFSYHKIPYDLCMDELWVNFQEQTQFNPTHKHTGLYSFVIWIDLPFKSGEQKILSEGNFEFTYTNIIGDITHYQIPLNNSFNGKIALFPAKMSHEVYPVLSNNSLRVTVSGNVYPKFNEIADAK